MTHSDLKGERIVIHWNTKDEESIKLIRARFNIPKYTTLNGFTPAILPVHDLAMFEETARRGYFNYRRVEWKFNGTSYSW